MTLTTDQRALVAANIPFAYWCVRRFAPRLTGPDAEDAVSAAFVGLCLAAARFDPSLGRSFRSLAGWACRSKITDVLRRRRARGMRQVPAGGPPVVSLDAARGPTEARLGDILVAGPAGPDPDAGPDVGAVLAGLPDREREVLVALYLRGETAEGLADRWRITSEQVNQLKRRAIGRAREAVG